MAKNYHVTRRETGYAVVGAGNQRASSVHRTQGEAQGIVTLKFKDSDSGKVKTLPACKECWAECLATGVTITEARPIAPNKEAHQPSSSEV